MLSQRVVQGHFRCFFPNGFHDDKFGGVKEKKYFCIIYMSCRDMTDLYNKQQKE